jgi:hypothetical protein
VLNGQPPAPPASRVVATVAEREQLTEAVEALVDAVERDAEARGYEEGYRRSYRDRSQERNFDPYQEETT